MALDPPRGERDTRISRLTMADSRGPFVDGTYRVGARFAFALSFASFATACGEDPAVVNGGADVPSAETTGDAALADILPDAGPADAGLTDGGGCAVLQAEVAQLLSAPQPCSTTADCMATSTACGLAGVCGAVVNPGTAKSLGALTTKWQSLKCSVGGICPNCPVFPGAILCAGGTCGIAPGAGQACVQATDCPQAPDPQYQPSCQTTGGFVGGYCAQPCANGWGCPASHLKCESDPSQRGVPSVCLLSCTTSPDCRAAEGYLCCPSWEAASGVGSVCYPGPCPSVN